MKEYRGSADHAKYVRDWQVRSTKAERKRMTAETVVLLSQQKADDYIEVELELGELDVTSAESKATYAEIKDYVKEKYDVNVHTSYIAQVKRMCGLDMGVNYNKPKKEKPDVKKCPQEKVEYIKDALRHFGLETSYEKSSIN